jgi:hypothetical protein
MESSEQEQSEHDERTFARFSEYQELESEEDSMEEVLQNQLRDVEMQNEDHRP